MQLPETQRDPVPERPVDVFEHQVREPGPAQRLSFFGRDAELYGFPSIGGVWILSAHPVLLKHLSIDRFTAIPSQKDSDPVAEDAFCESLKKIGATWWPTFYAADFQASLDPDHPPDYVFLGWPDNGGVWFIRLADAEFFRCKLGMLKMALDMKEYCKVLEMNGATFYENPQDCEYLKDGIGTFVTKDRDTSE